MHTNTDHFFVQCFLLDFGRDEIDRHPTPPALRAREGNLFAPHHQFFLSDRGGGGGSGGENTVMSSIHSEMTHIHVPLSSESESSIITAARLAAAGAAFFFGGGF